MLVHPDEIVYSDTDYCLCKDCKEIIIAIVRRSKAAGRKAWEAEGRKAWEARKA